MAKSPGSEKDLFERFGPHLAYAPPGGWGEPASGPAVSLVKTHCCFCGQQCGIQLKVRDGRVVGFEPWEEFPFNRGMLCPKGVRRYLQGSHPDRLLDPLLRGEGGFRVKQHDRDAFQFDELTGRLLLPPASGQARRIGFFLLLQQKVSGSIEGRIEIHGCPSEPPRFAHTLVLEIVRRADIDDFVKRRARSLHHDHALDQPRPIIRDPKSVNTSL